MGYLIIDGCRVDIETEVVHYDLPRNPAIYGIVARKKPPDLAVLHYTAAENPAATVLATLLSRRLSVHFCIDRDGVIHQFVDPGIWRCAHAGARANARSVGVEVVCYGWRRRGEKLPDPERPTYEATVHGWKTTIADYYPEQYDALEELILILDENLPIPICAPDGIYERLDDEQLAEYAGWVGHYHVAPLADRTPKIDPGPRPMDWIASLGREHPHSSPARPSYP